MPLFTALSALALLNLPCQRPPSIQDGVIIATDTVERGGASWDRFRGPNGSGVLDVPNLPAKLDLETNVRWRAPLPKGYSSPVLWEGRIYLTGLDGETLCTYCLNADDGRVIWRRVAPRPRRDKLDPRNHAASPSPAVGEEGVFVFFPEYGVLGYDHLAEELWRRPLGPFDNEYGMGASPILADGRVLLACDQQLGSFLVAFSAESGEELWRAPRPLARSGHCTPIFRSLGDADSDESDGGAGAELLLPGSFYLDAYDPATGAKRWFAGGLSFEMKSVPILWGDLVFANGYGSPMNQPGNQVTVPAFEEVLAQRDADGNGSISAEEMPPSRASAWFGFVDLDRDKELDARDWSYLEQALASKNGLLAFRVDGDSPADGSKLTPSALAWSYHRSVPQLPSPLVYRDVLYMLNDAGGILVTFDPGSGRVLERGPPKGRGGHLLRLTGCRGRQALLHQRTWARSGPPRGG